MEKKKLELKQIKNRLLWYLSRRDHSIKELKDKLKMRAEFEESDFISALDWLKNYGYLSKEEKLAQRLVEKLRSEGRGKNYIHGKLRQKGLAWPALNSMQDSSFSEQIINEEDAEKASAMIFLNKKLRGRTIQELTFEERMTLKRKLTTRGFSFETVRELLK